MVKFEQYELMIMDRAHKVSKKYNVDFDDCVSVGYEIFVNATKKYDSTKGARFGTYLFVELNRMADEAKRIVRGRNSCGLFEDILTPDEDSKSVEELLESRNEPSNDGLFELAKNELSYEAYRLFSWICSRDWQNWDKERVAQEPTKKMAIRGCGFPRDVVESAWAECESFWNKYGWRIA